MLTPKPRRPAPAKRPTAVECKLDGITRTLQRMEKRMSAQLDRLTAEVAENSTVVSSAIQLLKGLATQIRESKDDPAALERLASDLDAQNASLAAAVVENTPAENAPPAEPPA